MIYFNPEIKEKEQNGVWDFTCDIPAYYKNAIDKWKKDMVFIKI